MHLVVDHTGQKVQSRGVDFAIRPNLIRRIDVGYFRPVDQHGRLCDDVGQDDVGVFDQSFHGFNVRNTPAAMKHG